MRHLLSLGIMAFAALTAVFAVVAEPETQATPVHSYRAIRWSPHDTGAYTQGLVISNGVLYEGTGLYGSSSLRKVDLATGRVLEMRPLDSRFFGEGVTVLNGRVYQLTWKSRTAFIYDAATLELLAERFYPTEGWGLTTDGARLVLSDGSSTLRYVDPETFDTVGQVEVRDGSTPVDKLNELEFIEGRIYANVWGADSIAVIAPESGLVESWVDLSGLLNRDEAARAEVLNGIAWDPATRKLYVTGKLWPKLFEIEVVRAGQGS